MNDNTLISEFLSITGSHDTHQAQSYLEMSGFDLETAISLYLEHSHSGLVEDPLARNHNIPTNHNNNNSRMEAQVRAPDQTRRMRLMDDYYSYYDNEEEEEGKNVVAMEYPQGMIPPAMLGLGGFLGLGSSNDRDPWNVRIIHNPDWNENGNENRNENVIDTNLHPNVYPPTNATTSIRDWMNQVATDTNPPNYHPHPPALPHPPSIQSHPSHARALAQLFQPPTHLMYTAGGGFTGAKNMAKDTKRWLLVNIQSDEEFACHALNRDVWRDELVENLVREGFIFWQQDRVSPEGQIYVQRYHVQSYPHIAIIDPRTGRLMVRKEGWTQVNPLTPEQFAEMAADFCSRHSLDRPPPSHGGKSGIAGNGAGSNRNMAAGKNPESMTEEEQLQAALQASMMGEEGNDYGGYMDHDDDDYYNNDDDNYDSDVYVIDHEEEKDEKENVSLMETSHIPLDRLDHKSKVEKKTTSLWDEITSMVVGNEPSSSSTSSDTARIMIRMPDGKRLVRKFQTDDSVKLLYAFVAQQCGEDVRNGKEFEMKAGFPPKDLIAFVDESISSAGLAGESITVRWKEE